MAACRFQAIARRLARAPQRPVPLFDILAKVLWLVVAIAAAAISCKWPSNLSKLEQWTLGLAGCTNLPRDLPGA